MQKASQAIISINCTDRSELTWIEGVSHYSKRSGLLDVWVGDLAKVSVDEIIMLKNKLPFDKVVKTERFRAREDSNRYILAHGMLHDVIQRYTGEEKVEIAFTKYRKPYLPKHPKLSFNMSHSGQKVLLAFRFDGEPVGVDIEYMKRDVDYSLITESYYHPDERKVILENSDIALFYKLWTRKEALLKAMEVGLTGEIKKINALAPQSNFIGTGVLEKFNAKSYDIQSFSLGRQYFASLATLKNSLSHSFVSF